MTELLPCPFCGGKCDPEGWLSNGGERGPECEGCSATAESLAAWNRRIHAPASAEATGGSREAVIRDLIGALSKAQAALKPLIDGVYNDNGDMTVRTPLVTYDECVNAYFANRAISDSLKTALAAALEPPAAPVPPAPDDPAIDAAFRELLRAGDRLSFMAQTSGGTAGRDDDLLAAVDGWSSAKNMAHGMRRVARYEPVPPAQGWRERAEAAEAEVERLTKIVQACDWYWPEDDTSECACQFSAGDIYREMPEGEVCAVSRGGVVETLYYAWLQPAEDAESDDDFEVCEVSEEAAKAAVAAEISRRQARISAAIEPAPAEGGE